MNPRKLFEHAAPINVCIEGRRVMQIMVEFVCVLIDVGQVCDAVLMVEEPVGI